MLDQGFQTVILCLNCLQEEREDEPRKVNKEVMSKIQGSITRVEKLHTF